MTAAEAHEGASKTRPCPLLSERLRAARTAQSLSLRALAGRIGVSASLISQIETAKVQPSVNTLYALARELGLSIDDLLFDGSEPSRPSTDGWTGQASVVHAAERRVIELNAGVRWERLTPAADDGVDFFHVVYEPGASSMPADELHRHAGREWGYIMCGRLRVELDAEVHDLGPGDSITFDSRTPHRLHNDGDEVMRAIWFVVGRAQDFRFADDDGG